MKLCVQSSVQRAHNCVLPYVYGSAWCLEADTHHIGVSAYSNLLIRTSEKIVSSPLILQEFQQSRLYLQNFRQRLAEYKHLMRYFSTHVLKYSSAQILMYSSTHVLKHSCTQVLMYSNAQVLKCSCTQVLMYSGTHVLEHSSTHVLKQS